VGRADGARDEFEAFISRAYLDLVRFGTMLLGDPGRGEDLVQTALTKTYGAWSRLSDPAVAGAYTRKVMVREAGRWRRRRWVGERPTGTLPESPASDDTAENVADHLRLVDALRALPLQQRSVLLLRYMEGRSEAEAAELLGVSVGTVKSRAARGLAALRSVGLLDEDGVLERD
jgi:RNA polymerase sigma-70 factor (sigma-E family)